MTCLYVKRFELRMETALYKNKCIIIIIIISRGGVHATPFFRLDYNPARRHFVISLVDHLLVELDARFSPHHRVALRGLYLVPSTFVSLPVASRHTRGPIGNISFGAPVWPWDKHFSVWIVVFRYFAFRAGVWNISCMIGSNHSYYMNSYVTLSFNVGRQFCLMDVSQWLHNLQPKRHKRCMHMPE